MSSTNRGAVRTKKRRRLFACYGEPVQPRPLNTVHLSVRLCAIDSAEQTLNPMLGPEDYR